MVRDPAQLRAARKAAGIAGRVLAAAASMSPAAIGHMETGRYQWTALRVAVAISTRVGRDVDDLFDTSKLGLSVNGQALKAARTAAGLSRVALAGEVGVSPATVEQLENGTRGLLWRAESHLIAGTLGVPVAALFTEQEYAVPA
jgi:transcriptional regulator with XRE-family HTH domain